MRVHQDINSLPEFKNAVVTIGTFDGVHRGHFQIIRQLKEQAHLVNGETVIVTFHPHPRKIVGTHKPAIQLLNTLQEKITLLEKQGVDHLVVIPFTQEFAEQTAAAYINEFLVKYFKPHTLIIGYDHRFGKGREGDFKLLEQHAKEKKFHLIEIPQHLVNESAVSSTLIRDALLHAKIEEANQLLGYYYFIEGIVIPGNRLGRTIGYPTANLHVHEEKLIPGNGVYVVNVRFKNDLSANKGIGNSYYYGMMNIGFRPTIEGTKRVVEVNIFDFDADIYGEQLVVEFKKYLREEQKFKGLDMLKEQLGRDKVNALNVLGVG